MVPVEVETATPAAAPVVDIIAAKKPETSSTQATINLGESDSENTGIEDVQLKPQDTVNLMLQIQERLMDDDGGEEQEEEDEDDEMQGQTADQDTQEASEQAQEDGQ